MEFRERRGERVTRGNGDYSRVPTSSCPCVFFTFLVASLLVFSLLFAGCGGDREKIRVGVSISGISHPDFQIIERAIKEAAENHNARIEYDQGDFMELLAKGIDVMILSRSDPGKLESAIRVTHRRSIPVIILDCPPPQNLHVEACIKVNPSEAGKMTADYVVKQLGGKGNVIILEGPRDDEAARQITLGMYSVLEHYDSIRVVADERHPGWNGKLAENNTRFTLTKYAENIQAVLAGSSQLAMGAVRAVAERSLVSKIVTAGIGADLASCRAIIGNRHDVEVDTMPYERAVESLILAVAVAKGEDFDYDAEAGEYDPKIKVKFGPLRLITRENVSLMGSVWPQLVD